MIIVASKNKVKIQAVQEAVKGYADLEKLQIIGKSVPSNVSEQPLTEEEIIQGAINRAKNAYNNCKVSVGIESGLKPVPNTKTGYMECTVCAIYDGKQIHLGISSSFEAPPNVMHYVLNEGLDLSTAFREAGFTEKEDIGAEEGCISVLTKGRITRMSYTVPAIQLALVHLEHPDWYKNQ